MNNTWALTKRDGEVEFVTCNYLEEAIKLIGCTINDIINVDLIDSYFAFVGKEPCVSIIFNTLIASCSVILPPPTVPDCQKCCL